MARSAGCPFAVDGNGVVQPGTTVWVYEPGTTTPIAQTMYDAPSGGSILSNPLITDEHGVRPFYVANSQRVDYKFIPGGGLLPYTQTNHPVFPDPALMVTSANLAAAIAAIPGLTLSGVTLAGATLNNPAISGGSLAGVSAIDLAIDGARLTRPTYGSGLIFTPEYFYRQLTGLAVSTIVPGTTDMTAYVQAAIDAATAAGGGTVELEPHPYKLGPLNLTDKYNDGSSMPGGGDRAGVTLRGRRAQSTAGPTYWGTTLQFDVAPDVSDAAKQKAAQTRACIDLSGATYCTVENLAIRSQSLTATNGSSTRANAGIMMSSVAGAGRESSANRIWNVLVVGSFTTAAIVQHASSINEFGYVQAYNYFDSSATPTGDQGTAYGWVLTSQNFINPDLPGTGTEASPYAAGSNGTTINTPGNGTAAAHGGGCDQNTYLQCQAHDFAKDQVAASPSPVSKGAGWRLHSVRLNHWIGGDSTSSNVNVEINDVSANDPSRNNVFRSYFFHGNRVDDTNIDVDYAVYHKSATTLYGLVLDSCHFEASNAMVGAPDSATGVLDNLRILNPRNLRFPSVAALAPINGLLNLNNTNNAVRLTNAHLECNGMALTAVGGIDGTSTIINRGTYSSGHASQSNKAGIDLGANGWSGQMAALQAVSQQIAKEQGGK